MTKVIVVCGPPGAGKTTFVGRKQRWGDLVIDVDRLYTALSGLDAHDNPVPLRECVLNCREYLLDWLEDDEELACAWVTTCAPKRIQRNEYRDRYDAKVVVLEIPIEECLRRIIQDPERRAKHELWREWVENWWNNYERDERDIVHDTWKETETGSTETD